MSVPRLDPFRWARVCECGSHGFVGLTRGFVTIFDAADTPLVAEHLWQVKQKPGARTNYATTTTRNNERFRLHRLLLGPSALLVDHVNRDGLDNRRVNLRPCTYAQNTFNKRPQLGKQVPYKGVKISGRKYECVIVFQGKQQHLGTFESAEEAANVYDEAAGRLFGEFAYLNATAGGPR